MFDFSIKKYIKLLEVLLEKGYCPVGFEEFISSGQDGRAVILRHDVDRHPERALVLAEIEAVIGIKTSYHIRVADKAFNPDILKKLVDLGHELAYHYEDLSSTVRAGHLKYPSAEVEEKAFSRFTSNLTVLRQYYPVKVISMHGDPLSRVDNRDLWKAHNYHSEGIVCEAYLDIDFSKVAYLTDTGRRWNASGVNIRDRAVNLTGNLSNGTPLNLRDCRSTDAVIKALRYGDNPLSLIVNTHPQRWNSRFVPWIQELAWQNAKNVIKYFVGKAHSLRANG